MPCTDKKPIDPRRLWEQEDLLINHRITWLGVSQGLLFTAYAVVLKDMPEDPSLAKMLELIPTIGAVISGLVLLGVIAAAWAMLKIRWEFNEVERKIHSLGISMETTVMGLVTACGIPLVFLVSWLYLLCSTNS